MRIGIIFGGNSKEREVSFAGGRTVYDNLNKSLFEPVPLFVDSFGNFVLLNWEFVYKGSVRDFYPPVNALPPSENHYQIYAESLGKLDREAQEQLINQIGKRIPADELSKYIDFAFLCLHGPNGEDGRIQGLLEYLQIPFSGAGILASSIGIDKAIQKKLMKNAGFNVPNYLILNRSEWFSGNHVKQWLEKAKKEIGKTFVVKASTQGSSIGVSILHDPDEITFMHAINKSFFTRHISKTEWTGLNKEQQVELVRTLSDIREGIGIPLKDSRFKNQESRWIYHPEDLLKYIDDYFAKNNNDLLLESHDAESRILIEEFIEGKEFSCIVIQDQHNRAIALPPTEIRKGKELFDYRSKYLPGLSRKITPIDLPTAEINRIRKSCEKLFTDLEFDVYARIDGFIKQDGTIFLNDPNTTSGMMPSSFFFHQAAEIGLNPSQFLTYIIRTSLTQRVIQSKNSGAYDQLLINLEKNIHDQKNNSTKKTKVAVILGGYSSERHISVESGRNIYEKLASSSKYEPIPIFLTGNSDEHLLYQIPINILLKDNADDIKDKIDNWKVHEVIKEIISDCSDITHYYANTDNLAKPKLLTYEELPSVCDAVFIALHGRPGEDGAVQAKLNNLGMPYNGSDVDSSQITIDKYVTNEILKQHGFLVAEHMLVSEDDWNKNRDKVLTEINSKIKYPFITKPHDDGCSSAVRKIKNEKELEAFARMMFRKTEEFDTQAAEILHVKPREEFPRKKVFLVEELISKRDATHFLEVTGGMLTKLDKNDHITYEVFEASESLAEGDVLSLEEKFLAGQGQNITPARYAKNDADRQNISNKVKETLGAAAKILKVQGYCRIDAFVRVYNPDKIEVVFIEVNSLPGMTPATCIFHQSAFNGYKPYEFIDKILDYGAKRIRVKA